MKETALWTKIRPHLERVGKFQKISDRFTPGVPDVLGSLKQAVPVAMELKELDGVRVIRAKFRPGQLDWLRDWESTGAVSLILCSDGHGVVYAFKYAFGYRLEEGVSKTEVEENTLMRFQKSRANDWSDCVHQIKELILGS